MELASKESIASETEKVFSAIQALEGNARRCAELANAIQEVHRPALQSLESRIAETRIDLGNRLKLPGHTLLRELDREPDDALSQGRDNVEAARTMLIQGRSEAAAAAIDTMQMELARADFILKRSKEAVEAFDKVRLSNVHSLELLRRRPEALLREITKARQAYASSALMVRYSEAKAANDSIPSRTKIAAGLIEQDNVNESGGADLRRSS